MDSKETAPSGSRRNGQDGRGRHSKGFGGRGRGGGRGGHQGKKRDLGRNQYNKQKGDRRATVADAQAAKRQKVDEGDDRELPVYATKFTEEELKDEERRPKKKVAVLLGYSGTGYKGMQLAHDQKTIEGDLFKAFVAAGAISKANADDPRKSSFVRCARTDKGVHAAGNVVSLKLIVEDEDIVQRINDNLVPQIRVWGFERTSNAFSAYQLVDSRIYEYLIPSHSFLPPHPRSYLGRRCEEWADKKGETEAWEQRQREVDGFWEKIDDEQIEPILSEYNEEIRGILEKALWLRNEEEAIVGPNDEGDKNPHRTSKDANGNVQDGIENQVENHVSSTGVEQNGGNEDMAPATSAQDLTLDERRARTAMIHEAIKRLRAAYFAAKRAYRIDSTRLGRVRDALHSYVGTHNYHNYTVDKEYHDPSANRVIKSFVIHGDPIIINGTEWLSLKVHGQSFMMHQIRKMVGMAALVVRCGCDPKRIMESYGREYISIPKAPSLGLLLERPIFDTYNRKAIHELKRDPIDFKKYEKIMDEFKQKEIYDRMHADEEKENIFGNFFNHVDNFPAETFLFVTAGGLEAIKTKDHDPVNVVPEKAELVDATSHKDGDEADSDVDNDVKDGAGNEG